MFSRKNVSKMLILLCICFVFCLCLAFISIVNTVKAENEPVLATFTTIEKASVRVEEPMGIRFSTEISKSDYQSLIKNYQEVKFGTLIVPDDLANGDYTISNTNAVVKDRTVWDKNNNPESETGTVRYNGVVIGLKEHNYNRVFAARGYVTIDGTTYYSTTIAKRSPMFVATTAISKGESSDFLLEMVDSVMQSSTIELSKTAINLKVGNTIQPNFIAKVGGNEIAVTYSIENDSIVSFENGTLTALAEGETNIIATIQGKEQSYQAKCKIAVTKTIVYPSNVYYDLSENVLTINSDSFRNVQIPLDSVVKIMMKGNETQFTYEDNKLVVRNVNELVELDSNKASNEKNKFQVKIETNDKRYQFDAICVNKIIRQSDVDEGDPTSLNAIFYNDKFKTSGTISNWGGYYVLGENITFDITKSHEQIYTYKERFNGIFDGIGHTISNYSVGGANGAMFCAIGQNAVVKNINFKDVKLNKNGSNWFSNSGGILVNNCYGTIENILVEMNYDVQESSTTNPTGVKGFNGIIARVNESGKIKNCIVVVNDTSNNNLMHGYIVATNKSNIDNCFVIATHNSNTSGVEVYAKNTTSTTNNNNKTSNIPTTCKIFDNNNGTGFEQFFADDDVLTAIQTFGSYWNFDAEAKTISMGK